MMGYVDHSVPGKLRNKCFSGVMGVHPEASFGFIRWICVDGRGIFALSASSTFILPATSCIYGVVTFAWSRCWLVQVKRTSVFVCVVYFLLLFLSVE